MPSCSANSVEVRRARPLLGTFVEIRAVAPTTARTERAVRAAFATIDRVYALMSFHDAAGDVGRLNHSVAGRPVRVHPWTHRVLRRAQQLHAATHGLFDIAVAPALVRGGWLPGKTATLPPTCGSTADIVLLAGNRVRFRRPLLIDLGGIAKGFAVDCAVTALRRLGATAGVVNAGGDLRSFGFRNESVLVRRLGSPGEFRPLLQLTDYALATSAPYFAARPINGRLCSPIIDPRNHRPSALALSVSVSAPTCLLADALCKVVWLAGVDTTASLLRRHRARAWVFEACDQPNRSTPPRDAA